MSQRILILQGHPDASEAHFCHALADRYRQGAHSQGHEVRLIDIASLGCPLLRSQKGQRPPDASNIRTDNIPIPSTPRSPFFMSRAIEIPAADGTIDALIFKPGNAVGSLPAVVLFTDIGGLRPCYHEKAQRIADNGYAVLMPNVYYRDAKGTLVPEGKSFRDPDVRPTLVEYAGHLTPEAQSRDFAALLGCIDNEPEFADAKLGVVGYCMTGAFALRMAAEHPDRVAAAAGFHSARLAQADDPNSPVHRVGTIAGRVYFGHADKDALLPPEQIARMDEALAAAGVHFITELYKGATHGFTAKDAPSYDVAADALHHKRLAMLLEEAL